MCHQQLEKMLRKLNMEQNKVHLEEETTNYRDIMRGDKIWFQNRRRNKQEVKKTDDKEYNMSWEDNGSENDKDSKNRDSDHTSEEKQELKDVNIEENSQSPKNK